MLFEFVSGCICTLCYEKGYDGNKVAVMCSKFVMAGDIIIYCGSI